MPPRIDTEHTSAHSLQMTKAAWLKCESVDRGMFSDELAVVVSRRNGSSESYFVPAIEVEKEQRRVRVRLDEMVGTRLRDAGPLFWVTLPTPEPVTLAVDKSLLSFT